MARGRQALEAAPSPAKISANVASAAFDENLAEARLVNRLRDERGVYSDGWPTGLARRAVLEVGRRLHDRRLLLDPQHAVDLQLDELLSLLQGTGGPTGGCGEALRMAHDQDQRGCAAVPAGDARTAASSGDPAAGSAAKCTRRRCLLSNLYGVSTTANTDTVLHGLSVNAGTYEGTARLVDSSVDFGRVQQGDILVTGSTSP